MARKSKNGVNVSQAIRDYLKANSDVGPTAAAEAISKQVGKKVPATYVSNIKSTMNGGSKKKGRKVSKRGRKAGSAAVTAKVHAPGSNGSVQVATIIAVKELLASVGANRAKELIDLLA
jgi:hypothetical protein